jgi:thiamine pyrophosphate-dependent acetolactate synthase large subunit-like protein
MTSPEAGIVRRDTAKVMNRADLMRRLVARLKNEEAVVGGIGHTNFDLWASGQRPQNFYMLGSMGLAPSIALGVAMAQPRRKVFCLEGDGSMLMHLGSLGTIAMVAPGNLAIVLIDNGVYQITGSQKTHTSHRTDLVAIAAASGIASAEWARDEAHFEAWIDRALAGDGPWLIGVRTDDSPPAGATDRDPVRIRERFMQGLGVRKSS